jgi:hypothetical protein
VPPLPNRNAWAVSGAVRYVLESQPNDRRFLE